MSEIFSLEKIRQQYERHGCVAIGGIYDPDVASEAWREAEHLAERSSPWGVINIDRHEPEVFRERYPSLHEAYDRITAIATLLGASRQPRSKPIRLGQDSIDHDESRQYEHIDHPVAVAGLVGSALLELVDVTTEDVELSYLLDPGVVVFLNLEPFKHNAHRLTSWYAEFGGLDFSQPT